MTIADGDTREIDALRYGSIVVDPESGEVLEGLHAYHMDDLVSEIMASDEQEKQWKQRKDVMRIVLLKLLEEAGVRSYQSDRGRATIVPNQRRTARTERLEGVCEEYGLDSVELEYILRCARELSVTDLDALVKRAPHLAEPVGALITTGGKPYVKVTPALREASSRVTKEKRRIAE